MRHIAADAVAIGVALTIKAQHALLAVATLHTFTWIAVILSIGANWEAGVNGIKKIIAKIKGK